MWWSAVTLLVVPELPAVVGFLLVVAGTAVGAAGLVASYMEDRLSQEIESRTLPPLLVPATFAGTACDVWFDHDKVRAEVAGEHCPAPLRDTLVEVLGLLEGQSEYFRQPLARWPASARGVLGAAV